MALIYNYWLVLLGHLDYRETTQELITDEEDWMFKRMRGEI